MVAREAPAGMQHIMIFVFVAGDNSNDRPRQGRNALRVRIPPGGVDCRVQVCDVNGTE